MGADPATTGFLPLQFSILIFVIDHSTFSPPHWFNWKAHSLPSGPGDQKTLPEVHKPGLLEEQSGRGSIHIHHPTLWLSGGAWAGYPANCCTLAVGNLLIFISVVTFNLSITISS